MDTFLCKVLSNTITIAELQHLQGEIEGQLALSNDNSCLISQHNVVKSILDCMSRHQNQVANSIDGLVAGNTEYMCASDEKVVDHDM